MKHQGLFSSKDKSKQLSIAHYKQAQQKKNIGVVCCNLAWLFKSKFYCQIC